MLNNLVFWFVAAIFVAFWAVVAVKIALVLVRWSQDVYTHICQNWRKDESKDANMSMQIAEPEKISMSFGEIKLIVVGYPSYDDLRENLLSALPPCIKPENISEKQWQEL